MIVCPKTETELIGPIAVLVMLPSRRMQCNAMWHTVQSLVFCPELSFNLPTLWQV